MNDCNKEAFDNGDKCLDMFLELDDSDIISAMKVWADSDDRILATLSHGFINRCLFKVEIFDREVPQERVETIKAELSKKIGNRQRRHALLHGRADNTERHVQPAIRPD